MVKQAAIEKARSFRAQAIKGWLSFTRTTSLVEDEEGFTIVRSKRKATKQPNQRLQSVGRKLLGKPFGSNATIIVGRNQSNKITNALNPVGNS